MSDRSQDIIDYRDEMERGALSKGTIGVRMSVLVRCEHAIGHDLAGATTLELRDWLDAHKLNPKTRYGYISHLATFWKWLLAEERATANPTLRLTRPKLRRGLPRPVATADLVLLIAQAPTAEMRAMIILAAYAGLRCMEIAGIEAADVLESHDPPVLVARGKGDKERVIPIGATIIAALRAQGIPSHGPIFADDTGNGYQPWEISHLIRTHMHTCGLNASAHQLRHSFGTEVYRKSGDLRVTQELLGHSSPSTTAIYTKWSPARAAVVCADLFT